VDRGQEDEGWAGGELAHIGDRAYPLQRGNPVRQQPQARGTRLLRVELRRRQRAVLDRGEETLAVDGPGQARWRECAGRVELPPGRRVGVDEVKAIVADPLEKDRVGGRLERRPADVREHRGLQL